MLTRIAGACAASLPVSRLLLSQATQPASAPDAPTQHIPRYRGFNLQWERQPGDTSKHRRPPPPDATRVNGITPKGAFIRSLIIPGWGQTEDFIAPWFATLEAKNK